MGRRPLLAGDGKRIVSAYGTTMRVHDVLTGQMLHSITIPNQPNTKSRCFWWMPVPNQPALLVVGRPHDDVHLYDIEAGTYANSLCVYTSIELCLTAHVLCFRCARTSSTTFARSASRTVCPYPLTVSIISTPMVPNQNLMLFLKLERAKLQVYKPPFIASSYIWMRMSG